MQGSTGDGDVPVVSSRNEGLVLSFWLYSAVTTSIDLGNESPDSSHPLFRLVEKE